MRALRPALLLLLVGLTTAAPCAASASSAERRADARLDAALQRVVDATGGPPGVAATVQRGGDRRFTTRGFADVAARRRWRVEDRMRIASASKAFSGAVVLALSARGRLPLGATIGERLPDLPRAWSQVTVGQALHHTGGLPDFSRSAAFLDLLRADLRRRFDSRRLWAFVADEPLTFAPGSAFRYSNTDNIVAALFAEQAGGRTYGRLLRDLAYRPAGLRRTSLPSGWTFPGPQVKGYDVTPGEPPEDVTEVLGASGLWAAGAIVSTHGDLTRFIRAYAGARLFGRDVQRRQFAWVPGTSEPPGPGANSAGLAVFRYRTRCGTVYGHTGNTLGYTQFMAATADGRRSAVVSANVQLSENVSPDVWRLLRRAEEAAVCAALAR
jgi:D-alanyl-D-alanine carboxypeptidase